MVDWQRIATMVTVPVRDFCGRSRKQILANRPHLIAANGSVCIPQSESGVQVSAEVVKSDHDVTHATPGFWVNADGFRAPMSVTVYDGDGKRLGRATGVEPGGWVDQPGAQANARFVVIEDAHGNWVIETIGDV
jgi:hypothetical protein